MKEQKKISNPLTIIAIFAGLAEINGTVVLALVPNNLQELFVWFIILFPSILVLIFFSFLNWNPTVLYSPGDFLKDESFIQILNQNRKEYKPVTLEINKDNLNEVQKTDQLESITEAKYIEEIDSKIYAIAKTLFETLSSDATHLFEKGLLSTFSYNFQAPGYYLLSFRMNDDLLKENSGRVDLTVVIRIIEQKNGQHIFVAVGKNIVEVDYKVFSKRLAGFMEKFIEIHRQDK